jgi:hypothetical protein
MAFLTKRWTETSPAAKEKDATLNMWPLALLATGTPWCRDQLYEMKQWALLGQLGDPRAAEEEETPSLLGYRQEQEVMVCAFQAGDVRKAISIASRLVQERQQGLAYVRPQGGIPDSKYFPERRLEDILSKLVQLYPALSPKERLACFRLLGASPKYWPNDLIVQMLNDAFAPVRVSVLLFLLEHPRGGFRDNVARIEKEDPYPWCRRIAHEILLFQPDPLNPEQGIRFTIP